MTIIAIDIETGGLDERRDALLEIGAIALDDDFDPVEVFEIAVDPSTWAVGDAALVISGIDLAEWHGVPLRHALQTFAAWIDQWDDPRPLAHGATFERRWFDELARRTGVALPWDRRWRCSCAAYSMVLDAEGSHGSASQEALAIAAGHWTAESAERLAHRALPDAEACAAGYRWLVQRTRRAIRESATLGAAVDYLQRKIDHGCANQTCVECDR